MAPTSGMSNDENCEARELVRKDENLKAQMPPENGTQLEVVAVSGIHWRFKLRFPQEGINLPMQRQVQPDHSGRVRHLAASVDLGQAGICNAGRRRGTLIEGCNHAAWQRW